MAAQASSNSESDVSIDNYTGCMMDGYILPDMHVHWHSWNGRTMTRAFWTDSDAAMSAPILEPYVVAS